MQYVMKVYSVLEREIVLTLNNQLHYAIPRFEKHGFLKTFEEKQGTFFSACARIRSKERNFVNNLNRTKPFDVHILHT